MARSIDPALHLQPARPSIAAHSRNDEQSIFPIVQGGLDPKLREQSVKGE